MALSISFRTFSTGLLAGFLALSIAGCDSNSSSDSGSGSEEKVTVKPKPKPIPKPKPGNEFENAKSIDDTCILWKPTSEGDGRLVVLTPSSTGSTSVYVLSGTGKSLDKGRYVGRTNGNRATYRFSRGGRSFPDPSYLKVGSSIYKVKRPGSRHSC